MVKLKEIRKWCCYVILIDWTWVTVYFFSFVKQEKSQHYFRITNSTEMSFPIASEQRDSGVHEPELNHLSFDSIRLSYSHKWKKKKTLFPFSNYTTFYVTRNTPKTRPKHSGSTPETLPKRFGTLEKRAPSPNLAPSLIWKLTQHANLPFK